MVFIRNGNGDYIDEPAIDLIGKNAIEDVLDDDFDYLIYRENSIKNTRDDKDFIDDDIDIEQLYEALFDESSKEEIVEVKEEVKILNEYFERIRDVQWDYERDNSVNPTLLTPSIKYVFIMSSCFDNCFICFFFLGVKSIVNINRIIYVPKDINVNSVLYLNIIDKNIIIQNMSVKEVVIKLAIYVLVVFRSLNLDITSPVVLFL